MVSRIVSATRLPLSHYGTRREDRTPDLLLVRQLLIPAELLKPNADGFCPNMISIKDAVDPDLCKIEYESDQEDLDNIAAGPYLD